MKESSQKFLYFNRDSRAGVLYFWLFFFKSTLMPVIMIGQYKPSENEADRMCVQGSLFIVVLFRLKYQCVIEFLNTFP